jgi:integrase
MAELASFTAEPCRPFAFSFKKLYSKPMAWITKRSNSLNWYVGWEDPLTGKDRYTSTRTQDRDKAELELDKKEAELSILKLYGSNSNTTKETKSNKISLESLIKIYQSEADLKPKTHQANNYSWKKFVELTKVVLLEDITPELIKAFKSQAELSQVSPAYTSMILRDTGKLMKFAIQKELIKKNPFIGIKLPLQEDVARVLTAEEQASLIERANPLLKRFIILALNTGLRISQIVFLDWKQVKFDGMLIHVPGQKRQKSRHIPILKLVPEALGSPQDQGRVFDGITVDGIQKMWNRFLDRGNKEGWFKGHARFHDMRHTFCTHWGPILGPYGLRDLMGWSTVAMTDKYCHTQVKALQAKMKAFETIPAQD